MIDERLVCPHCSEKFDVNEFEIKILDTVKKALHTLESVPMLIREARFEELDNGLEEVDIQISRAKRELCDYWDSVDSEGYHRKCDEEE